MFIKIITNISINILGTMAKLRLSVVCIYRIPRVQISSANARKGLLCLSYINNLAG